MNGLLLPEVAKRRQINCYRALWVIASLQTTRNIPTTGMYLTTIYYRPGPNPPEPLSLLSSDYLPRSMARMWVIIPCLRWRSRNGAPFHRWRVGSRKYRNVLPGVPQMHKAFRTYRTSYPMKRCTCVQQWNLISKRARQRLLNLTPNITLTTTQ